MNPVTYFLIWFILDCVERDHARIHKEEIYTIHILTGFSIITHMIFIDFEIHGTKLASVFNKRNRGKRGHETRSIEICPSSLLNVGFF